jgi:hypothetical protein
MGATMKMAEGAAARIARITAVVTIVAASAASARADTPGIDALDATIGVVSEFCNRKHSASPESVVSCEQRAFESFARLLSIEAARRSVASRTGHDRFGAALDRCRDMWSSQTGTDYKSMLACENVIVRSLFDK